MTTNDAVTIFEDNQPDGTPLAAGDFSSWLRDVQAAIDGEGDSDVPCGGCTACCTSSQFVHIGPDEADTLAHIPKRLLFPAPGQSAGHVVLGYDDQGRCPMLGDGGCSIYDHRPRTCRTYDCRVFPASGLEPDEPTKVAIRLRARRWRFDDADGEGRTRRDAVRAAAAFLRRGDVLRTAGLGSVPTTQLAVLAIELHGLFLSDTSGKGGAGLAVVEPDPAVVEAELSRLARGRSRRSWA